MKILRFIGAILSFTALLLWGCTKDEPQRQSDDQMVAVRVGADISTRAVGALWNDNDAIGITMFNQGTHDLAEGNFKNRKYSIYSGESGVFNAFDNSSIIYFPKNGDKVDFLSYYPYTTSMTSDYVIPLNVSDQSSLPDIDFMTAQHTHGDSKNNPSVQLHFSHKLSNIIVNLQTQTGDSPTRLINSRIKIKGMLTTGSYKLINNTLGVESNSGSGADFELITNPSGVSAEGIVLPRAASAGVVFEISLTDGSNYIAYMSSTLALESGYQYIFYITLNKTPIEVSADIKPWNETPPIGLNALAVSTTVNASSGVNVGDVMRVYGSGTPLAVYTYGSDGKWSTFAPIYWENLVGTSVLFNAAINPVAALNSTQLPDILVADPISVARDNGVNFVIRHAASKVTVTLTSNDGSFSAPELAGATITLPSYKSGGVETNGVFIPGIATQNIVLSGGVALFQPQVIAQGSNLVTVTINGKNYYAKAPVGGVTYASGEARKISIDLLKTHILVSATVVDWVTGQNIGLQTQYVTVVTPNASSGFSAASTIDLFVLNNSVSSKFTYQVNGTWSPTTPIYWDNLTTLPAEIAAAYPSDKVVPLNKTVSWSVYGNQSTGITPSDLLVAYIPSLAAGQPANLLFQHAMNKVVIILKEGVGFSPGSLNSATVVIKNMPTVSTVNLTSLAASTSSFQDIIPFKDSDLHFSALVVPCTVLNGTQILSVTVAGDLYPVKLSADMTFATTKINTLTITINKTPIGISASVENWGIGNNGGFTIE